jgi:mannitol/fructose-specific phosphotransferase system IIA component (Ntr-type)
LKLFEYLRPERILIAPTVTGRDHLFTELVQVFSRQGLVGDEKSVVTRLLDREAILSTGIGGGVAVPHAQVPGLGRLLMAASTHPDGLAYPALDNEPVRLVFCLLGDASTAADHLAGLARLARLARKGELLEQLINASSGEGFLSTLQAIEES